MQNKPNSGSLQDGTSKPGRGLALREKGDDRKESISTFASLLSYKGHAEKSAELVLAPFEGGNSPAGLTGRLFRKIPSR
jgi:hypothetical protein